MFNPVLIQAYLSNSNNDTHRIHPPAETSEERDLQGRAQADLKSLENEKRAWSMFAGRKTRPHGTEHLKGGRRRKERIME
jgi:hypothetical protein